MVIVFFFPILVKMTSALQKSECCSATSAAQHPENCSETYFFACGMLQGWGLEWWGLGLPEISCQRILTPNYSPPAQIHCPALNLYPTFFKNYIHILFFELISLPDYIAVALQ